MSSNSFSKIKTVYEKLYPVFSFKNYKHSKFFESKNIENKKEFYNFFTHISGFSNLTWEKIKTGDYHFHEIDNDKNINTKLKVSQEISLIQFKLSGDRESRIIGFFDSDNVFNVVAYDYNHKVYPRK